MYPKSDKFRDPLMDIGRDVYYLQSTKILLLPPKYEIIMVPSYHSFFQYCDSNIGLFSIAPCKVITLYPLCILLCIRYLLFFMALSLKLSLFKLSLSIVVALSRS